MILALPFGAPASARQLRDGSWHVEHPAAEGTDADILAVVGSASSSCASFDPEYTSLLAPASFQATVRVPKWKFMAVVELHLTDQRSSGLHVTSVDGAKLLAPSYDRGSGANITRFQLIQTRRGNAFSFVAQGRVPPAFAVQFTCAGLPAWEFAPSAICRAKSSSEVVTTQFEVASGTSDGFEAHVRVSPWATGLKVRLLWPPGNDIVVSRVYGSVLLAEDAGYWGAELTFELTDRPWSGNLFGLVVQGAGHFQDLPILVCYNDASDEPSLQRPPAPLPPPPPPSTPPPQQPLNPRPCAPPSPLPQQPPRRPPAVPPSPSPPPPSPLPHPPSPPPFCADKPGWRNPYGKRCSDYEAEGHCVGGTVREDRRWTAGSSFNNPEVACCACGKASPSSFELAAALVAVPNLVKGLRASKTRLRPPPPPPPPPPQPPHREYRRGCTDTVGWVNQYGCGCACYEREGHCHGGVSTLPSSHPSLRALQLPSCARPPSQSTFATCSAIY